MKDTLKSTTGATTAERSTNYKQEQRKKKNKRIRFQEVWKGKKKNQRRKGVVVKYCTGDAEGKQREMSTRETEVKKRGKRTADVDGRERRRKKIKIKTKS